MKKTIPILLLFLMFIVAFSLAGCGDYQVQLKVPENVSIDGAILQWNSVEGADGYIIFVNESETDTTNSLSYDLSKLLLVPNQEYRICVKAKGDGYFKLGSDYSQTVVYSAVEKTKDQPVETGDSDNNQSDNNNVDKESKTSENLESKENNKDVQDNAFATKLFELGLGSGVNAFTAKSTVGEIRLADIFDDAKLKTTDIGEYQIGSSRSVVIAKESLSEEMVSFNSKLVQEGSISGSYAGLFSAGFEEKFALSTAREWNHLENQYYYILKQYVSGSNYQLKNYTVPSAYQHKLSTYLLDALDDVRDGNLSAEQFFSRFGTHIKMAVCYGGMMEVYYAEYSKSAFDTASLKSEIELAINAGIQKGAIEASTSQSGKIDLEMTGTVKNEDTMKNLNIAFIGGKAKSSLSFKSFAAAYPDWVEEMKDTDNYQIVDVADGGLVPIWYYFPDEYADVAEILLESFNEKSLDLANWLKKSMTVETVKTDTYNVVLTPKSCKMDNGYNDKEEEPDEQHKKEVEPHVVDLYVMGCVKNKDGTYSIKNSDTFEIGFIFLHDTAKGTELLTNRAGSGLRDAGITNDDWEKAVVGTKISGKVGKGAYYCRVFYQDGKSVDGYRCNFMDGHIKKDTVSIVTKEGVEEGKKNKNEIRLENIKSIEITCVYEIDGDWYKNNGKKGGTTFTNWRCDYTIHFK